ncbi:hypothetical protein GCM10011491_15200 [Brucella endophytica]|uniref:Uncharacterized protein n=2 Tax=Brucella endophytica TaxID=1963359 RepID=A0A916S857_9HYPH|nr:hypothetical protein GCM10011491_15200 [Brucella endophytica]
MAMDREQLIAGLSVFDDGADAQRLEDKIAELIEKGDENGLKNLGEQIREKDGPLLEGILALSLSADVTKIASSMTPCRHANIAIRLIALMISNGIAKPVIRSGIIMIDGTKMDSDFANYMWMCKNISRLPPHEPRIGSRCIMTGAGCQDDPDMN